MLRLAVVTAYFPLREQPYRGHSAYQTLLELKRWMDIEVFCPLASYSSWLRPRNFVYVKPDATYTPPGIRANYIEYPAVPLLSRAVNGAVCARRLLPHLRRFNPDAILNYGVYPEGYAAVSAGTKLGVPVVVGALGSDLNRIPDRLSEWMTRKTLRQASAVLTVSRQLRDQAIRLGALSDRTSVVGNGCDTAVFHPADRDAARNELGLDPDCTLILYVGWLVATKGLRELLEAFIRLVPSDRKLQLACIGEGALQGELKQRVLQAGIEDRVRFEGACSSQQIARWLAAANVFCLPSYAEGCPNAVIEALSCGRPVVASNVGGIPDLIDSDSGILVRPRDPKMLAEALRAALLRPWNEAAICRKFHRGWNQVASEVYQIYIETWKAKPLGELTHNKIARA